MRKCRWTYVAEQWFDGERPPTEELKQHVASCPVCGAHLAQLRQWREGVRSVSARPEIRDAQFPAFLEGIRDRLDRAPQRHGGAWALLSAAAAALIVAVALFLVLTDGSRGRAEATVVESCYTELEGATVTSYASDNGVTTVWVKTVSEDDVW